MPGRRSDHRGFVPLAITGGVGGEITQYSNHDSVSTRTGRQIMELNETPEIGPNKVFDDSFSINKYEKVPFFSK